MYRFIQQQKQAVGAYFVWFQYPCKSFHAVRLFLWTLCLCSLGACSSSSAVLLPQSTDVIRLYNLDRNRKATPWYADTQWEHLPYLILFPDSIVFDLDAPIENMRMTPLCEGVIEGLQQPLTLKLRFLFTEVPPGSEPTGWLPQFDTTLVIDPALIKPGDYELVKRQAQNRVWLEIRPLLKDQEFKRFYRRIRTEFIYDATSKSFRSRLQPYGKTLEEVWPSDRSRKAFRFVTISSWFKKGGVRKKGTKR